MSSACGTEAPYEPADLNSDFRGESSSISGCVDGQTRACHLTLDRHGDILSCYVGTQACGNGQWGECGGGQVVDEELTEEQRSALNLAALTTTSACTDNPCDPSCRTFKDVPPAATQDTYHLGKSDYDWEVGTLSGLPPGLVSKGLIEPCETGSDCQFNTYCVNPDSSTCDHDMCASGDAMTDSCNSCVDKVCDSDPTCCTRATAACTHNQCETGAALKSDCDPCVTSVCSAYPNCCKSSGSWDATCVAAVTSVCGATCGCCTGDTGYDGKCYSAPQAAQSWTAGRTTCQAHGQSWELAAVDNAGENSYLYGLNSHDHWLGLTEANSVGTTSNWAWSSASPSGSWNESTKTGLSYTNFASGEPNSSSYWKGASYGNWKNCARLKAGNGGTWTAEECSNTYEPLCEGPGLCLGKAPPPYVACSHDPCQTGAALNANCDACAKAVCAADSTCCSSSWTASCVALVASKCGTQQCGCASGETSYGGHCYYYESTTKSWLTARTSCQTRGTGWDLASVTDASEETSFEGQYTGHSSSDMWIGFQESSGKWTWANGDPSGTWKESGGGSIYTHWKTGQPDAIGNNCLMMSTGGYWYDQGCTSTLKSLCEGPVSKISATKAVTPLGSMGTSDGGGIGETRTWSSSCVDKVKSVCDADCSASDGLGEGSCLPWYPGQTDSTCNDIDLAIGIPCGSSIPVCNHGTKDAPAGIKLVHFPANSQQYPSCSPDLSHPQMYECTTKAAIPAGRCIDVTDCPKLVGNREFMVNPAGSGHISECSCLDNWSLYSGGTCGTPICAGGTSVSTLKRRPVDIIISVDNSGSMQNVIKAIQDRINGDFATIIGNSGVDYRVIIVSRYGNVNIANYDCSSGFSCAYMEAYAICIGSPLSGLTCPTSALSSTPTLANVASRFYQHSTDIGSRDILCKLLDSYDTSDPYPNARTSWTSVAPSGWGAFLRKEALKEFVLVTDDGIAATGGTGECASSTGITDDLTGANNWDKALRQMAPDQFGAYNSSSPATNRNYILHSIIGMAGNAATPTALQPTDAVETKCCKNGSTSSRTCPANSADTTGGIRYGSAYQELSRMSGGLRYPICFNSNFNDIFNAIAAKVVDGAKVSCDFTLQNASSFDINTAQVLFQKDSKSTAVALTRASSLSSCGTNQWYSPNTKDLSILSLCPSTCTTAQASSSASISVEVGCQRNGYYDPYSFTQVYQSTCDFDELVQWEFLKAAGTTPADSNIVLSIRVAATEDDLKNQTWKPLSRLSTAAGNSTCTTPSVKGCPLDVYSTLGIPGAHATFAEVKVEVNPSSAKTDISSLKTLELSHSCVPAQ
ncbi:MAG TPA: C-type lectin domain-containing protein [Polyangiaceae bacterium]|nr:C-type lectin domain-containing protein [Polyangiaceae bacterium]